MAAPDSAFGEHDLSGFKYLDRLLALLGGKRGH
jgi:hypothetical protein